MNSTTESTSSRRAFLGRVGAGAAGIAAAANIRAAESGKPLVKVTIPSPGSVPLDRLLAAPF